jgi:G3E family GTPase
MKLHIVGGFLGSGKTTAIIQAAKGLMSTGLTVGVITNDQGKYLVDTAFVRLADIPTVEVTGGCFCCNYDDLSGRIDQLIEKNAPDVIFAESVGSCADIVATVVKPLLEYNPSGSGPSSFSVFTDARLLRRRLKKQDLPFSDDVVYIFDQQIEEAGLIVVNKIDLLKANEIEEISDLAKKQLPAKPILFQTSLNEDGVKKWVDLIHSGQVTLPTKSLDIDYARYGAGEAQLAWLDQSVHFQVPDGQGKRFVIEFVRLLVRELSVRQSGIGHLKFIIQTGDQETKLSITTLPEPGWENQIGQMPGSEVHLLINARVEIGAENLSQLVKECFERSGIVCQMEQEAAFHPGQPHPTHRIM